MEMKISELITTAEEKGTLDSQLVKPEEEMETKEKRKRRRKSQLVTPAREENMEVRRGIR